MGKRICGTLAKKGRACFRLCIGLGLFLAWFYSAFYSCVLVQAPNTVRESERYWAITFLVVALWSAVLLVFLKGGRKIGGMRCWALAMVSLAAIATVVIYVSCDAWPVNEPLATFGAVLAGIALPVLLLLWGNVLRQRPEDEIEFVLPASFLVALVIYLPVVALKTMVSAVIVACLPWVSVLLALGMLYRKPKSADQESVSGGLFGAAAPVTGAEDGHTDGKRGDAEGSHPVSWRSFFSQTFGLWKTGLLFAFLWFGFAFFRSYVSPTYFTDRYDHYLLPFLCAGVMSLVILVAVLFRARGFGLFTTYRWILPFVCAGYALLFVTNEGIGRFAFTVSFIGLVGLQLSVATAVVELSRRAGLAIERIALPLLMGIGVGVFCGSMSGLWALETLSAGASHNGSILFIPVAVVTAVMAWGCDAMGIVAVGGRNLVGENTCVPTSDKGSRRSEELFKTSNAAGAGLRSIDEIAAAQADSMARRFALSSREHEVLTYLLSGRSRPYIRDELHLSLNTINTHVRNVYAKAGVHSQQELLTLARSLADVPEEVALPAHAPDSRSCGR